jgi:hypothetical protein
MLNSPKKYRGIKFLNVDQQFLNVKVLNKNKAKKSLSINSPILNNRINEKSLKSSVHKTEDERSPIIRNNSIKKSNKKLFCCKRLNSIEIKDSNIYKLIKKKNIEEKKNRSLSPYKIIKSKPRRINSFKKIVSCKNMYLRSSLFNNQNKIINSTNKKPKSNNNFNIYNKINERSKKKNKSKDKKTINNNNNSNKKDCVNIIQLKAAYLSDDEDTKYNNDKDKDKDKNKISKNIKKFFCCI